MVEYICNRCTKKFDRLSNYNAHINKKKPCKDANQNKNTNDNLNIDCKNKIKFLDYKENTFEYFENTFDYQKNTFDYEKNTFDYENDDLHPGRFKMRQNFNI